MLPLALPLGVAVEPLGWVALELVSLEELELLLLGEVVEPPPDELPLLSFSVSLDVALDDGGVVLEEEDELGELGLVALGEVELLELDPALGELDGGVDGLVDEALLLEPGAGALEVLPVSFRLQAASPKASATAIANAEILMCSSRVGYKYRGEQASDRL